MCSETIEIRLNGEAKQVKSGCCVEDLLMEMAANRGQKEVGKALAVELNEAILPQDRFASTLLKSGDEIEVVTLVGGG